MNMDAESSGSVWNKNAWHWEEKNYTKWAKGALTDILENIEFQIENFKDIKLCETVIEGDASASIRKGKRIITFDFEINFNLKFINEKNESFEGNIKIYEFSTDNVEDGSYEIFLKMKNNSEEEKKIKFFFEKNGKNIIKEKLHFFLQIFQKHDEECCIKEKNFNVGCSVKLSEEDKKKSEIHRNELKQQLKQLDEARTLAADLNKKNKDDDALKGEGSVWNVNSYHWEEKQLSEWCRNHLKDLFKNFECSFLDESAIMTFFNTQVQGEGSLSIRKGKKILVFDLTLTTDWTCTCRSKDGKFMADAKGQLNIDEFSSENLNDSNISFLFDFKHPASERINDAIRKDGKEKIQNILKIFIEDFKNK